MGVDSIVGRDRAAELSLLNAVQAVHSLSVDLDKLREHACQLSLSKDVRRWRASEAFPGGAAPEGIKQRVTAYDTAYPRTAPSEKRDFAVVFAVGPRGN